VIIEDILPPWISGICTLRGIQGTLEVSLILGTEPQTLLTEERVILTGIPALSSPTPEAMEVSPFHHHHPPLVAEEEALEDSVSEDLQAMVAWVVSAALEVGIQAYLLQVSMTFEISDFVAAYSMSALPLLGMRRATPPPSLDSPVLEPVVLTF
jgi:hypothetical protein